MNRPVEPCRVLQIIYLFSNSNYDIKKSGVCLFHQILYLLEQNLSGSKVWLKESNKLSI